MVCMATASFNMAIDSSNESMRLVWELLCRGSDVVRVGLSLTFSAGASLRVGHRQIMMVGSFFPWESSNDLFIPTVGVLPSQGGGGRKEQIRISVDRPLSLTNSDRHVRRRDYRYLQNCPSRKGHCAQARVLEGQMHPVLVEG